MGLASHPATQTNSACAAAPSRRLAAVDLISNRRQRGDNAYNTAAISKYNSDLKSYNTYWNNYYNTPVKLSLRGMEPYYGQSRGQG